MSSVLAIVRDLLRTKKDFKLTNKDGEPVEDIVAAKNISFGSKTTVFSLDEVTDFEIEGEKVPLRVVIQCWLHRGSNAAEYLADCQKKQIFNVSFLQRTGLLNWLSGSSGSLQISKPKEDERFGKKSPAAAAATNGKEGEKTGNGYSTIPSNGENNDVNDDPVLREALSRERVLLDHNSSLRGNKPINFSYLIKDAELKLVQSLKSSFHSKKGSHNDSSNGRVSKSADSSRQVPRKDPIILIPSAASSVFTMSNIKKFLQDAHYVNPRDIPASQVDLVRVEKKFDRISRPIRFIVVNNTRMFTKPEYWDRVVAVFTMGHKWQFNNYQWNTPQELFQHCKGYYFHYAGDVVPQHVQQWNVQQVQLDKNIRFKDIEVVRFFWNSLERELIARGYK